MRAANKPGRFTTGHSYQRQPANYPYRPNSHPPPTPTRHPSSRTSAAARRAGACRGCAGSLAAASRSSSHSVRYRPRAPAAGTCTRPAPPSASATASALPEPQATTQISFAALRPSKVSDNRSGGGLGESRTAITGADARAPTGGRGTASSSARPGPTPSSTTSKLGTSPGVVGPAGVAQRAGIAGGSGIEVVAVLAAGGGHRVAGGRPRTERGRTAASRPACRCGRRSRAGTNRSSPQNTSTADQSSDRAAAESASAAQTFSMIDPAVRASAARPRASLAAGDGVATSRATTSAASCSADRLTTVSGAAIVSPRAPARGRARCACAPRPLVEVRLAGHRAERLGVGLVGVQPAQLLGQQRHRSRAAGTARSSPAGPGRLHGTSL